MNSSLHLTSLLDVHMIMNNMCGSNLLHFVWREIAENKNKNMHV